ncbi:MAG: LysR family transcriptional regulator [Candidatus Accumulibacter sp.]|jgi:LysR family transcriptional activator of nhaA|nr:LysR family transcriptional regulator [Accumulibacter sp.]
MLNYRHLYYFWMVSKEGGFARAAARLGMAVQTISAQVRELEKSLGHQLLKPLGRGIALTEAGQAAQNHAEGIFQMGKALVEAVQDTAKGRMTRLSVGLSDDLSKLAAHALLGPILDTPDLRLVCREGGFERLQVDLALHSLDLVLTGRPSPDNPNLYLISHRLVSSPVAWYGPARLIDKNTVDAFPRSLERLPILLPMGHSALRVSLDHWFHAQGLRIKVVGEFEDSALMSVFAARGLGVFPVSRLGADDLGSTPGLLLLGCCEGVNEDIYAIFSRHGRHHPLVQKLLRG